MVRGCFLSLALALLLGGCASSSPEPTRDQVERLFDLYMERVEEMARRDAERAVDGIERLEVSPDGRVDLVARDAPLMPTLQRLLDEAGRPYRISGDAVSRQVSERLAGVPLDAACTALLSATRGACVWEGDVLEVELRGDAPVAPPPADGEERVTERVLLRNLTAERAAEILGGVYDAESYVEPLIRFGVDRAGNTVSLAGPAAEVARAARLLRDADRGVDHVMIEANVFSVKASELQRLGARVSGSSGEFSDVTLNLGSLLAGGIQFTHVAGADNVAAFTAMIDVLLATDLAQVLARPFVGVISGERATISITNDRQVAVLSESGFAPVTTTVSSGIELEFGAVVRPGGSIRLEVTVGESIFVPTVEGAISEVARTNASTTMEVPSGQSIVIGGISFHRSSESRVGIPGLRDVPVLGLLFGSRGHSEDTAQLLVVITPRVWQPGMDRPEPALRLDQTD